MIGRKTETLYGSAPLNGATLTTTLHSVRASLTDLEVNAQKENREVLWDTLEFTVERQSVEDHNGFGEVLVRQTFSTIEASASAVKR